MADKGILKNIIIYMFLSIWRESVLLEYTDEGEYCDSIWDTVSCWPKTRAGHLTQVSCPLEFDGVLIDQTGE